MAPRKSGPSMMRVLGEIVGAILRPVDGGDGGGGGDNKAQGVARSTVRHETQERTEDTPQGRVTFRRTVIEEVEVTPRDPQAQPPAGDDQPIGR